MGWPVRTKGGKDVSQDNFQRKTTRTAAGDVIDLCQDCDHELTTIEIPVDGNNLLMHSCDRCDKRWWKLAGEQIDLADALIEVKDRISKN